jgi:hypothetical protein
MWSGTDIVRLEGSSEGKHRCVTVYKGGAIPRWRMSIEPKMQQPLNLTLNLQDDHDLDGNKRIFVLIAVALQLVALIIPALITYQWQWQGRNARNIYGYPCFVAGSVLLLIGMYISATIVDQVTTERTRSIHVGIEATARDSRMFILQEACIVADTSFKRALLAAPEGREHLYSSTLAIAHSWRSDIPESCQW